MSQMFPVQSIRNDFPILGEKIPMYLGSWCLSARMGNAIMFPKSRAITVCFVVRTPASIKAPAAAKPEVNSAAKLKTTTESDSTGMNSRVRKPAMDWFKNLKNPLAFSTKTIV